MLYSFTSQVRGHGVKYTYDKNDVAKCVNNDSLTRPVVKMHCFIFI